MKTVGGCRTGDISWHSILRTLAGPANGLQKVLIEAFQDYVMTQIATADRIDAHSATWYCVTLDDRMFDEDDRQAFPALLDTLNNRGHPVNPTNNLLLIRQSLGQTVEQAVEALAAELRKRAKTKVVAEPSTSTAHHHALPYENATTNIPNTSDWLDDAIGAKVDAADAAEFFASEEMLDKNAFDNVTGVEPLADAQSAANLMQAFVRRLADLEWRHKLPRQEAAYAALAGAQQQNMHGVQVLNVLSSGNSIVIGSTAPVAAWARLLDVAAQMDGAVEFKECVRVQSHFYLRGSIMTPTVAVSEWVNNVRRQLHEEAHLSADGVAAAVDALFEARVMRWRSRCPQRFFSSKSLRADEETMAHYEGPDSTERFVPVDLLAFSSEPCPDKWHQLSESDISEICKLARVEARVIQMSSREYLIKMPLSASVLSTLKTKMTVLLSCQENVADKSLDESGILWSRWTESQRTDAQPEQMIFKLQTAQELTEDEVRDAWEKDILTWTLQNLKEPCPWQWEAAARFQTILRTLCGSDCLFVAANSVLSGQYTILRPPCWQVGIVGGLTPSQRVILVLGSPVLPPVLLGFLTAHWVTKYPGVPVCLENIFVSKQNYQYVLSFPGGWEDVFLMKHDLESNCFDLRAPCDERIVANQIVKFLRSFCTMKVRRSNGAFADILRAYDARVLPSEVLA